MKIKKYLDGTVRIHIDDGDSYEVTELLRRRVGERAMGGMAYAALLVSERAEKEIDEYKKTMSEKR